jgi:protein-S-isoprenylcysteine O-methyltransferase Ste14
MVEKISVGKQNNSAARLLIPLYFRASASQHQCSGFRGQKAVGIIMCLHDDFSRLGTISVALWTWIQTTLGRQWSAQLQLRDDHHLITKEPYPGVRHRMCSAMFGFGAGIALVAANWFFILLTVPVVIGLVACVPRKEQMMIEAYGEGKRAYMRKTRDSCPSRG